MRAPLEAGKTEEQILLEFPEGTQPCLHFDCSPVRPATTLVSYKAVMIKWVVFQVPKFTVIS